MIYHMDIKGNQNNPIRVILIPFGDSSPNFPGIKNREHTIEFYDRRYSAPKRFTPDGQFIARYYLSSLASFSGEVSDPLYLYSNVPSWTIDANTFSKIRDWALYLTKDN